jgi:hypothetical protein
MTDIRDINKGWQTGELRPCKDILMNCDGHNNDALDCLCAQGQILHLIDGVKPEDTAWMTAPSAVVGLVIAGLSGAIMGALIVWLLI